MEPGGARLIISLREIGIDGVLEVADDGPRIVADARTSGTGLGGANVRELVDRAGGRLVVEAAEGVSARVTFPLVRSAAEAMA